MARRHLLPWTYGFFGLNLLGFAAGFMVAPDNLWFARVSYVWLTVFNLLSISLALSVLAHIFVSRQAKRLFALMAGGASLGGLTGPLSGTLLVAPIGHAGLLLLSAGCLVASTLAPVLLQRWRDARPAAANGEDSSLRGKPLGGNPFAEPRRYSAPNT